MSDSGINSLAGRYERIAAQLVELFCKTQDPTARMATAAALLQHKMPKFFWTGFYRLQGDALIVGPYQGPLACAVLPGPEGVCWAALREGKTMIIADVGAFPGHVACDKRSRSEIVLPMYDGEGRIAGVLDVDSERPDAFNDVDAEGLKRIADLIHA